MKKAAIVLAIISVLIVVSSIFLANTSKSELLNEVGTSSGLYIDGSDFSPMVNTFGDVFSSLLSFTIVIVAILLVAGMWAIYGIVALVIYIVKKNKEKETDQPN